MGKNKYGNLEEGEFQNALDSQTGGKAEVTDIGDNFEVYFSESNRYYEVDGNGNTGDFTLGATDQYPGDITKDENGKTLTGDSEEDAYQINCIEDLVAFSNITNGTGKYFQDGQLTEISDSNAISMDGKYITLTRELNFKSKSSYIDSQRTDFGDINGDDSDGNALMTEMTTGRGFKSIGKVTGICFDGNNNEIKNLYIKKEDWSYIGLFSNIGDNSKLTNLTVSGTIMGDRYVALIVGSGEGIIVDGCTNKCNMIGEDYIGGIFSYINYGKNIEITNCKNEGKIESRSTEVNYMGGIVANNDSENCIIDSCYNLGEVISKDYVGTNTTNVGGIAGNNKGKIINCYNKGTTGYGLVATNQGKIENCYNAGNCYLNAMINNNYYTNSSVINSYTLNQANIKLVKNTSTGKVDSLSRIVEEDELKSKEFVTILNNGQSGVWIYDENKINDGYPILNCSIVI